MKLGRFIKLQNMNKDNRQFFRFLVFQKTDTGLFEHSKSIDQLNERLMITGNSKKSSGNNRLP